MKTIQLPEFVNFLCALEDPDFKGEKVDRYLTDHRIEEDSVLPFVFFRELKDFELRLLLYFQ